MRGFLGAPPNLRDLESWRDLLGFPGRQRSWELLGSSRAAAATEPEPSPWVSLQSHQSPRVPPQSHHLECPFRALSPWVSPLGLTAPLRATTSCVPPSFVTLGVPSEPCHPSQSHQSPHVSPLRALSPHVSRLRVLPPPSRALVPHVSPPSLGTRHVSAPRKFQPGRP